MTTVRDERLPTFLVIGASKTGTTSLHHYLSQHPDIYMSPEKEPGFFLFEGKPAVEFPMLLGHKGAHHLARPGFDRLTHTEPFLYLLFSFVERRRHPHDESFTFTIGSPLRRTSAMIPRGGAQGICAFLRYRRRSYMTRVIGRST